MKNDFGQLVWRAMAEFSESYASIGLFSIPFVISLPLALLLPNYLAFGGIFLRPGSIGTDITPEGLALTVGVVVATIALYSLAVVAVNTVIRSKRTLNRLRHMDFQRMESSAFRMFATFFLAFLAIFAFNLLVYRAQMLGETLRIALSALFSLIVYFIVLFAPQGIVLDGLGVEGALSVSVKTALLKPAHTAAFVAFSLMLLIVNAAIFTTLSEFLPWMAVVSLLVNGLLILPFLEVLKVQLYLSKYTLL